jgi:UDP-GlcNAc:undecaprenyl-phosphate/decaprenyl-phosphate GlcNAc-1-phosphate transferase
MDYNSLTLLISFLTGLFLIFLFKRLSLKFSIFRQDKGISYLGGLAISISFLVAILANLFIQRSNFSFNLFWIITFSLGFLILEFFDDLKDFSLRIRIVAQLILIVAYLLLAKRIEIYFFPAWLNYVLSFLWIMGITNAFNLLDIKDGLCAGVALITGLFFALISLLNGNVQLSVIFLALAGALCAFLIFNLPPAKVYMGNSGSHFLGFIFAALSIRGDYATLRNPASIFIPVLLLAFPIIDTSYLIFQRIRKRILPLKKSNDHIFMHMISNGFFEKKMLVTIYFVTLLWGLTGLSVVRGVNILFFFCLTIAVLFSFIIIILAARAKKA